MVWEGGGGYCSLALSALDNNKACWKKDRKRKKMRIKRETDGERKAALAPKTQI